jgi:tetratricopeptide (TPR) repeat protein
MEGFDLMRWIYTVLILLLVLMTSAQCQLTTEDWFNKGRALISQGKYDEAIQAYDIAIQLRPDYAEAYYSKGVALDSQGKYDEAIQDFDKVIQLEPDFAAGAWYDKGLALKFLGRTIEANAAFAKAKELGYTG